MSEPNASILVQEDFDNLIDDLKTTFLSILNVVTPGSDIMFRVQDSEIIWGRDGNDSLLGFDPAADRPGQWQIDILAADVTDRELIQLGLVDISRINSVDEELIGDLTPRDWNNRFILGDWKQPYYVDDQSPIFGLNQLALVLDFNPSKDIIQLHGTSADYQLAESPLGTAIFWQQDLVPDLIAFLPGVSDLSLKDDYFQFEGNTPPKGPVLGKTQQLGTVGIDSSSSSATTPSGNVYLAGATTGSLGGLNAGSHDAWITQYDNDGNQLWLRQFGTSSADLAFSIDTDNEGNAYVLGLTKGNLGATNQGVENFDVWLAKYDSDGNQEWLQQFGTELTDLAFSIDVDDDSNVYLSGFTVKEDPNSLLLFQDDVWVTKYDGDGNQQWFQEIGTPFFDEAYGVAVDRKGNVYSTGWTLGDFGGENAGLYDVWIAKQDNNGQVKWLEQIGTDDYEFPWGIDTDSQGNIYITGWTLGKLGKENAGSYDAWLAKYDSRGNQVWLQQFGTVGDDAARGIKVDFSGNIFLTGYTDKNFGGKNAGLYDVWAAKYDSKGNQVWLQQFGSPNSDVATNVTVDNAGNLYVTGFTDGSLGDTNTGSLDGWVAQLSAENGTLQDFTGTPEHVTENDILLGGDSAGILSSNLNDDILNGGIGVNLGSVGGEGIKPSAVAEFPTTNALTSSLMGLTQIVTGAAEIPIVNDPLNESLLAIGLDVSDKNSISPNHLF